MYRTKGRDRAARLLRLQRTRGREASVPEAATKPVGGRAERDQARPDHAEQVPERREATERS